MSIQTIVQFVCGEKILNSTYFTTGTTTLLIQIHYGTPFESSGGLLFRGSRGTHELIHI